MINGEKVLDHPIRWAMVGGGRAVRLAIFIAVPLFVMIRFSLLPALLMWIPSVAKTLVYS